MGEASSFVAVRLMRIVPIAAIILASFYIFNTCFAAFQATDVPVPEEWKKHDVVMEEESLETITATLTGYPDSTPTPHVLTIAEIEELENKGDIAGFSDEDEDEDEIYLDLDDEDDWTEEGLRKEMVIGEGEEFPSENDEGDEGVEKGDDDDGVDWSRFAYIQYVTNEDYLCNSVMIFEALHRLGSKADRLLMYPKGMLAPDAPYSKTHGGQLLIRARDEYNVTLQPIEIQHRDGQDDTWADSFTKLLAFNQTQYDRVLSLDSDSTVLQHMDELFQLPPCPVAMPRAYWLYNENPPKKILSSQLMLIQPDDIEFERIVQKMNSIGPNDYDMEIVNSLYLDSALILPHRKYDMLTAEFRNKDHTAYLGSEREKWNSTAVLDEAKFVHFSDWPVPKPWIHDPEVRTQNQPDCPDGEISCPDRDIWNGFYTDFADNKERVCESVGKSGKWINWKRR
ncbi:glucose N-acetyltransferase 1 [Fusarium flagelliforme]|uniref:Glucose n-acetyltransferase 1 n=1 Tax=Fusarium flagelliforme TaxID=2675880 RepID=A0A395N541_9HYPO|nr:glucose N-acetyltransferase 1 [Fusarium flagelliforme]KAH7183146.1 glucose N-acetyltransferase 1 [Fusarium flagelliforme]RFN55010.1 glucose n-acetyltransferase 1 [Fusarium flagelliforme]